MGKQFKQLRLLAKKNFILLWQRKFQVLFELFITFALLLAFSFLRKTFPKQSTCMGASLSIDPFHEIWDASWEDQNRKMIAMAPATYDLVPELSEEMLKMKAFKLADGGGSGDVTSITLNSSNYIQQLKDIQDGTKRYVVLFPTTKMLDDYLETGSKYFKAAIVFEGDNPKDIRYTIRYHKKDAWGSWNTDRLYAVTIITDRTLNSPYDYTGFSALQRLIDSSILLIQGCQYNPSVLLRTAPTPSYEEDFFVDTMIPAILPASLLIGAFLIASSLNSDIVEEKCTKMREIQRMMGLTDSVMWLGWLIQRSFPTIFLTVINTIALKVFGYATSSDGTLIFVFLLLYYSSFTAYIIFLTSLQRNLKAAPAVMGFFTFICYLPYIVLSNQLNTLSRAVKMLISVFPLSGVSLGLLTISDWEKIRIGSQWSNLGSSVSVIVPFSVGDVMLMLFIDCFIYGVLTWYIENVFPGEFGVPNKPGFFLTRSYWSGTKPKGDFGEDTEGDEEEQDPTCHEKITQKLTPGITIRRLNKTFQTLEGPKVAVKNLSVEMFKGQITALLGHNGAGKTTTINMLTGMYPPTSGDARVGGHSIIDDMQGVRESMGVCPQHNILFKFLTVEQHLEFFIRLKGVEDDLAVKQEIESMLEALSLKDKRNTMSKSLSGGMKRKLSVGIALSGGSKIVMLDEPSTGLDVSAKRDLWDMLLKMKADKTIIITTHSMDEADVLGDRIAIMAAGNLVCSGSSMFLKRRYGVGYHLTLVKDSVDMSDARVDDLTWFLQSYVPSAQCNSNVGSELSYLLNASEVPLFVKLFQALEEEGEKYGISNFGVSLTTMEEVFIKAGEGYDSNVTAIKARNLEEESGKNDISSFGISQSPMDEVPTNAAESKDRLIRKFDHDELNSGLTLLMQQFVCQVKKRFIVSKRSIFMTLARLSIPIIFIIIGLITYKSIQTADRGVPRVLTLKEYPKNDIPAKIYFADMRASPSTNYTAKIVSYLSESLDVDFIDVSVQSNALNGSYGDTPKDCCSNPFLQLAEKCVDMVDTNFSKCYDDYPEEKFTYSSCRTSCGLGGDDYTDGACTVRLPIKVEDVKEGTNYYQNYFLGTAAKAKGKFYVNVQGGITLSDTSKLYAVYDKEGNVVSYPVPHIGPWNIVKLGTTDDVISGWVSYEGVHLLPAFQSAATNLILTLNDKDVQITVTNHLLPEVQDPDDATTPSADNIGFIVTFIFASTFVLAVFSQAPIDERTTKSKHLQQISGVNSAVYWGAMLTWDYFIYFTCLFVMFILIVAFQVEGLSDGSYAGSFLLLIILAGFAAIPVVYILSHIFAKTTSAYGFISFFFFVVSLAGIILYMIIYPMYEASKDQYTWIRNFDLVLLLHPHYALVAGMYNLMLSKTKQEAYDKCVERPDTTKAQCSYLKPDPLYQLEGTSIGRHLVALVVEAFVYLTIIMVFETYWYRVRAPLMRLGQMVFGRKDKNCVSETEDDNVTAERTRVEDNLTSLITSESVVMYNLHRQFGKTTAVQNLSLAISKGECFGLLGVNGAGKTTTFNMMTGDTVMTSGKGYLYGHDVTKQLRNAQKYIGYCPQFDALIGALTGRELLEMFANLRGIPAPLIRRSVEEVITMFNLEDHADKECRSYSGGNKRKLSTGIAIIGSPPLIFLDEPTSGMDPTARRFLWDVLCYLRSSGCSIVLTTHSMEECEALCTRIVIMVNGAYRCLGSIQQLKSTYSQGYTVCILMEPEDQDNVINFVEEQFKGAVMKEHYPGYLMYSLGTDYKWSYVFEVMETNKGTLRLHDYSVSQTTLEQVFLNFAKEQREPEEKKKGWFGKKKKEEKDGTRRMSVKKAFVSKNRETGKPCSF